MERTDPFFMAPAIDPRRTTDAATPVATFVAAGHEYPMSRGEDGVWYFSGTPVEVPGAVDVTLAEVVDLREVRRPGGEGAEAVLISRSEVETFPDLAWVEEYGVCLQGGAQDRFEVPWDIWRERSGVPVDVWTPERNESGIKRVLGATEREVRFARWELDLRTARRARVVAIATALGMTRREISQVLGVSAGRVQQLVEDMPPATAADVDALLTAAVRVLRAVGEGTVPRQQIAPPGSADETRIDELITIGLLEETDDGLHVTADGERAEIRLRAAAAKANRRG